MKRFILTVASVAFTVALCGGTPNQAEAKPSKSSPSVKIVIGIGSVHSHHSYTSWCYSRNYDGLTTRCWFPQYQCYGYFCPADGNWYFWCDSQARYLPTSLLAQFPPTRIVLTTPFGIAPVTPVTQTLPPGATAVPAPMGDVALPK
jgi:hypothetical protein